ncbi:MAG: class II fructose-bisphosphate aldolase, partial [Campylobacteraceae bacterium]|nr:class II fructose-bisphosphate aldolase [Campylobacteraceae bacterium]
MQNSKAVELVGSGVISGESVSRLFELAKAHKFAFPAVNVVSGDSINAALEAAKSVNSPIIVQFSNGGGEFLAGKGLSAPNASVLGTISGAQHTHLLAKAYGIPVILHTDHAARKLLPWIDALLDAGEEYFKVHKKPLFSSHMLDLSEEPLEQNIATCVQYLKRMS